MLLFIMDGFAIKFQFWLHLILRASYFIQQAKASYLRAMLQIVVTVENVARNVAKYTMSVIDTGCNVGCNSLVARMRNKWTHEG